MTKKDFLVAQRVHNARTTRAKDNIKKMFVLGRNFGLLHTEKEKQIMEDLHPGMYEIAEGLMI